MSDQTATASETEVVELRFDAGLPGFPDANRFALLEWAEGGPGTPFKVLHSLEETVEFLVVPPAVFFPDYMFELDDETVERLGIEKVEDVLVLCIVTVPDKVDDATINLQCPVVVNTANCHGAQVVLVKSDHDMRTPLFGGR